jgi:very-short-patch-repair endonuclease
MMAFNEANEIHLKIELQLKKLAEDELSLIELRNKVDGLDQKIEAARNQLSENQIQLLKNMDLGELSSAFESYRQVLSRSVKDNQGLFTKLFWGLSKNERFVQLQNAGSILSAAGNSLDIVAPKSLPDDSSINDWIRTSAVAEQKIRVSLLVTDYLNALGKLQSLAPLESIAKSQATLLKSMSNNAERLWNCWLRIQPSKLSNADRQLLQKYSALLKMVIETGPDAGLAKDVYTQYRELFTKVAHLLPCWAVTSLSARGKVPFEPGFFDLVVFDEASQCDIASALPLLYRAKRALIIGDPKQLAHISGMPRGQDQQLLQRFDLVDKFPHWAYSYNSLFDLAAGFASGEDIVNLRDHHRSHADIIEFSNHKFYEGRLRVATRYNQLNRPPKEQAGVRWVDVPGRVSRPVSGGAINDQEATGVIQTLRDLVLTKAYRGSIGVVSPFRAQANLIREMALSDNEIASLLTSQEFLVDTVHKFQGDERDVMIFSPVVSLGITPGAISFLKNNGNLFNVAITRARAQLIVVGDRTAASQCEVEYLAEFAKYVAKLDHAETKKISQDVSELGVNYPSVVNPERVSDWERHFYKAMFLSGIKALPQYQVEKYALDFAVFSEDRRLNIEVDGERYHRNWTGELCRRDQIRNLRMIELGWDVMRFWVYEIRDDLDGCIKRVSDWISES